MKFSAAKRKRKAKTATAGKHKKSRSQNNSTRKGAKRTANTHDIRRKVKKAKTENVQRSFHPGANVEVFTKLPEGESKWYAAFVVSVSNDDKTLKVVIHSFDRVFDINLAGEDKARWIN